VVLFIFINALSSSLSCLTFTNTLWMCGNQSIIIISLPIHLLLGTINMHYSKTSDWFNKGLIFVIDLLNHSGDLYNYTEFIYNCGLNVSSSEYFHYIFHTFTLYFPKPIQLIKNENMYKHILLLGAFLSEIKHSLTFKSEYFFL